MLCVLPFAWLVWGAVNDALGANPAEYLIRATGDWTLRLLCVTLAVTPLRVMLSLPELAKLRRTLGLFTYFYVCPIKMAHLFDWWCLGNTVSRAPKVW